MEHMETPEVHTDKKLWIVIAVLTGLVLFLVGIMAGYYFLNIKKQPLANISAPVVADLDVQVTGEMLEDLSDIAESVVEDNKQDEVVIIKENLVTIKWYEHPQEVDALDVFKDDAHEYTLENSKFYETGWVSAGKYKTSNIFLASIPCTGICFYPNFYRFIKDSSGKIFYIGQHSASSTEYDPLDKKKFTVDSESIVSDLQAPAVINLTSPKVKLYLDSSVNAIYNPENTKTVVEKSEVGKLLTTDEYPDAFSNVYDRFGLYAQGPDGALWVYHELPQFVGEDGVPQFTYTTGLANTQAYAYADQGGCGSTNYLSVVPSSDLTKVDLKKVATAVSGDDIFSIKNDNHKISRDFYENVYTVYGDNKKVEYKEFIEGYPLLYFYDSFGRLIKLESREFLPATECGKPVIYLYPEEEMTVHVEVAPVGGFSYTDPVYDGGWDVIAKTNGDLVEIKSGLDYPYLFWEGDGGIYTDTDYGWTVAENEVEEFLVESLTKLGLNTQEILDFNEFWLPRMTGDNYYFISFFGTQVMDQLAPLKITPQPDTIIRVLMDFKPLQEKIESKPYPLTALERKGFTVIEWGGVIR